jgi:Leucine-rich repeat (LRR) protein
LESVVPETLDRIREAKILGSGLDFASLPDEQFRFEELRTLDFSRNHFASLPRELCDLKELRDLKLSSNKVTGEGLRYSVLP